MLGVSTVILAVILGALLFQVNKKSESKAKKKGTNGKKSVRKKVKLNSILEEINEI